MKTTPYFRNRTLRDRPELQKYLNEIADAIDHYHAIEQQAQGDGFTYLKLTNIFASLSNLMVRPSTMHFRIARTRDSKKERT